jgi:hypothetical protein
VRCSRETFELVELRLFVVVPRGIGQLLLLQVDLGLGPLVRLWTVARSGLE